MIEEAQDYNDAGWTEVNETVLRERDDFKMHFYGVHRGQRGGGFAKRILSGQFTMVSWGNRNVVVCILLRVRNAQFPCAARISTRLSLIQHRKEEKRSGMTIPFRLTVMPMRYSLDLSS